MSRVGLLDLVSGISGDMFLGALVGAGVDLALLEAPARLLSGDRVRLRSREVLRGGMHAVKVDVLHDGDPIDEPGGPLAVEPAPDDHDHRGYTDIDRMLETSDLSPPLRDRSRSVFRRLARVEAARHGVEVERVHFHELGSWDAVADITGVVAGVEALGLGHLYHGPVAVGGGRISAAHGTMAVPAPATLELLETRELIVEQGVGELTTPTGAVLIRELAEAAPPRLAFRVERCGYGAGRADPPGRPNVARLTLGEPADSAPVPARVAVVEASLDDCTPEEGGHLIQLFLEAGAHDVTLSPLTMKKSRPGFLVRLVTPPAMGADLARRLLEHSTTLGARVRIEDRYELPRRLDSVRLPEGEVRVKVALLPDGRERPHPEFEDLRRVSESRGVSLTEVRREVERLWEDAR